MTDDTNATRLSRAGLLGELKPEVAMPFVGGALDGAHAYVTLKAGKDHAFYLPERITRTGRGAYLLDREAACYRYAK